MAINYDEPITFGVHGTANGLNCTGIDFSEQGDQSWTVAPVAEMDLQLPFARQDVICEIEATPFTVPDQQLYGQKLFLFIGGLFVGFNNLRGHGISNFGVSRSAISARTMRMTLVIPDATSPASVSRSEDMRDLGIYLRTIVFRVAR